MSLQREAFTEKPQSLRTVDGRFDFNLATNLAQMQPEATVRNQDMDLTPALLTLAGAMFKAHGDPPHPHEADNRRCPRDHDH